MNRVALPKVPRVDTHGEIFISKNKDKVQGTIRRGGLSLGVLCTCNYLHTKTLKDATDAKKLERPADERSAYSSAILAPF